MKEDLTKRPFTDTMRSESVLLKYLREGETIAFMKNGSITITVWDYKLHRSKLVMLWTDYMECMTWLVERYQK